MKGGGIAWSEVEWNACFSAAFLALHILSYFHYYYASLLSIPYNLIISTGASGVSLVIFSFHIFYFIYFFIPIFLHLSGFFP